MVDRQKIIDFARRNRATQGVLVTLVQTEGSSYRKPGARLLTIGNEYVGTISGGCLESEVVKKAAWAVRSGAVIERYSTAFDDISEMPYGLGCGGIVDLLFEPMDTPEFFALVDAFQKSLSGEPRTVITWIPGDQPMRRAILSSTKELFCSELLSTSDIATALAGEDESIFVEHLEPPQRLVILGAGDDAKPLVSMASLLGWNILVVDGRAHLAKKERFPEAGRVVVANVDDFDQIGLALNDAVVIMTHSFEQDSGWLSAVLPYKLRYLGVLGARHRTGLLVHEVAPTVNLSVTECCERIYAPVGLDLGGEGPEAIALAIIAEIQACCMGKLPLSRHLSQDEVSSRVVQKKKPDICKRSVRLM